MLSLEHCKKTLEKNGRQYTDEQVKNIREFLYFIAEIQYNNFKNGQNNEECDNLHKGIDRRPS